MVFRVSPRFLTCLEESEPTAFALFALNIVLFKSIDDAWSLGSKTWNDRLVVEHSIRDITSSMQESWLWAIEWPRKILGGQIRRDDFSERGHRSRIQLFDFKMPGCRERIHCSCLP